MAAPHEAFVDALAHARKGATPMTKAGAPGHLPKRKMMGKHKPPHKQASRHGKVPSQRNW